MPRALWDQRVTLQHAWTINSLWLLKYEVVITSSQSIAHLLKPSLDAFVTSAYYREQSNREPAIRAKIALVMSL